MRLLLVERDARNRAALTEALTNAGFAVTSVEEMASAWELYSAVPFPIVIAPMERAVGRGLTLCRKIRRHPEGDFTTVIVSNVAPGSAALAEIVDAEADEFLLAPLEVNVALTRVTMAAKRRRKRFAERESGEERIRRLLDTASDAIVAIDHTGKVAFANRESAEMFGCTADGMVGQPIDHLMLPEPEGSSLRLAALDVAGVRTVAGRRKDGSTFPAEARLSAGSLNGVSLTIASIRDVTAERTTDSALRTSEQRLRLALIAAKMGTWDWNIATGELHWSNETERIAGVQAEGSHSIENFYALLHPDDRGAVKQAIQHVLDTDDEYAVAYRMVMPDGAVRWSEAFGSLERGDDGTPLHMRGIALDVTDRKLAEEALREGEERFRAAFDHAAIGMALVGRDGSWLRVNHALCDLLGYEEQELLATGGFQEITAPDDLELDLDLLRRLTAGEFESYQMEKRYIRKDGEVIWAQLSVSMVHDAAGEPVYYVSQIQDVTERNRALDAVRSAHDELGRVIGAVSDCLYSSEMQPDGTFEYRYFSPVAQRAFGRPAEFFLEGPHRWLEVVHPDDRDILRRAVEQVRTGAFPEYVMELRVFMPDGSIRWIQDSVRVTVRVTGRGDDSLWINGVLTDITERKEFEAELAHRALHDALTGLPNRPLFLDRLSHALQRRRGGGLSAVLFLDLDNFKTINDGLGHEAGDDLLRDVASRIGRRVRSEDTLARFGGDEFVILLEEISCAEDAQRIADDLIAGLSTPSSIQGREVYVGVSIGVALAESHADPSVVLRNADAALYRAKAGGRNRSEMFDPRMTRAALERLELEADLRRALETGDGLTVHYQPIFDLDNRRLAGCEALVRWLHPAGALLQPDAFVPIAEETGLIVPLGQWVLDEACRQLRRWHMEHDVADLTVSVNLSTRSFKEPSVIQRVSAALDTTGLPPSSLILEVTEHVIVDSAARETLAGLKALGVGLAIDDFGAGYSSLNYLSAIDADILKIDRRFITGMTTDGREAAIVRAVLALGESLGLTVIAEGVETVDQMLALRRLGCRRFQGYLLGRPVPADHFAGLFTAGSAAQDIELHPNGVTELPLARTA